MQQGESIETAKNNLVKVFKFNRADFDKIWPEWKKGFIDAGFFVFK